MATNKGSKRKKTQDNRKKVDGVVIHYRKSGKKMHSEFVKDLCSTLKQTRAKCVKKKDIFRFLTSRYKNIHQASKATGVKWSTLRKACELKENEHGNCMSEEVKTIVEEFYMKPGISVHLPDTRQSGKKYLERTLESAHIEFTTQNPNHKLAFSTFAKLRPKSVKLMGETPDRECICAQCASHELICRALNTVGNLGVDLDKYMNVNRTLCKNSKDCTPLVVSKESVKAVVWIWKRSVYRACYVT